MDTCNPGYPILGGRRGGGKDWGLLRIGLKASHEWIHECNVIVIFLKVNEKKVAILNRTDKSVFWKNLIYAIRVYTFLVI